MAQRGSKLYAPHRVIGLIADGEPAAVALNTMGDENFLTVRVAKRSFQIFRVDKLTVRARGSLRCGRPASPRVCIFVGGGIGWGNSCAALDAETAPSRCAAL